MDEEVVDVFNGVKLKWVFVCRPVNPKLVQKSSSHGLEIRAFELTFPHKYKDAKSMKQESKSSKIFTLDPDYACFGFVNHMWVPLINFPDGSYYKYVKHRIDVLDKENFVCKYTLIEGDSLGDKLESIVYEVKFEASSDNGGSVCKVASEYHTKGDHEIKEEVFKASQEKAVELYKVVEAHLLANPDLYA
ncbi:pathogenesis-related protein STH-2-like [Pistacia vera]|uniref:pathogenesis-related protein STH-2-like n=1 Tax=Pistacia vera TaxID=55513 RepID=UPI001262F751|nr:pathogenesis-related protein STH-2-like [Pistacia vera]